MPDMGWSPETAIFGKSTFLEASSSVCVAVSSLSSHPHQFKINKVGHCSKDLKLLSKGPVLMFFSSSN